MRGQPDDSHTAARQDADHRQAAYFRVQLGQRIELLNEQTELLEIAVATHLERGELRQARFRQHDLRLAALEHRDLIAMLSALDDRFPPEDPGALPATSSQRHLTVAPG